jgi:hypothetical protein
MGSPSQILQQAETNEYKTAKIKLGDFSLQTAKHLVQALKTQFRLRIDIQEKWPAKQVLEFCGHFLPSDFDFIEDPGCDIHPYPMKTETKEIWKPMVRGIPSRSYPIILSSVFETGVGIRQLVILAEQKKIPLHPLGIGTYSYLENDFLENRLIIKNGHIYIPQIISVNTQRLTKI